MGPDVGTSSISGSVETRAMLVNWSFFSGLSSAHDRQGRAGAHAQRVAIGRRTGDTAHAIRAGRTRMFSITMLMPRSRSNGCSPRASTSFEPPAFQGTMKVISRCGKSWSAKRRSDRRADKPDDRARKP